MVFNGNTHEFGSDNGGERNGKIPKKVDSPVGEHVIDELIGDRLDIAAKFFHFARSKGERAESTKAGMHGIVHKQKLLAHHLGKGFHEGKAKPIEVLWARGTVGGQIGEDGDHFGIASNHPGVHVGIPVDRVVFAKSVVKRIGIGSDVGIEKPKKTEMLVIGSRELGRGGLHGH
jgi:hypothetical protein